MRDSLPRHLQLLDEVLNGRNDALREEFFFRIMNNEYDASAIKDIMEELESIPGAKALQLRSIMYKMDLIDAPNISIDKEGERLHQQALSQDPSSIDYFGELTGAFFRATSRVYRHREEENAEIIFNRMFVLFEQFQGTNSKGMIQVLDYINDLKKYQAARGMSYKGMVYELQTKLQSIAESLADDSFSKATLLGMKKGRTEGAQIIYDFFKQMRNDEKLSVQHVERLENMLAGKVLVHSSPNNIKEQLKAQKEAQNPGEDDERRLEI